MYAESFGLHELPFNNTPDPRFFYSTPDHEEALASLVYAVQERKGFVLLTGDVGAGKTLMSRMMLRRFENRVAFATINHALQSSEDLMEAICHEFELSVDSGASCGTHVRALHDFLLEQFAGNTPVVLILDEAQNLPPDAFEQLRMIGNLEADDAKLLQIVIVGQPELQSLFRTQALRQLGQRLFRSFHLTALRADAAARYIQHRLKVAGATRSDIFDQAAIDLVCHRSGGLPRLINTLCDNAMLSAYAANQDHVDAGCVRTVIDQMMDDRLESIHRASADHAGCGVREQRSPHPSDLSNRLDKLSAHIVELERNRSLATGARLAAVVEPQQADVITKLHAQVTQTSVNLESQLQLVHAQVQNLTRRIDHAAIDVRPSQGVEALVAAAKVKLTEMMDQARRVTQASQTEAGKLEDRIAAGKSLQNTLRTISGEVRNLVKQVRVAAVKTERADSAAKRVCQRLDAQTSRASELADGLSEIIGHTASAPRGITASGVITKQASTSVAAMTVGAAIPKNGNQRQSFAGALSETHESLSGLRSLARQHTDDLQRENGCGHATSSTERLADQVERLALLVGRNDPSPQLSEETGHARQADHAS